MSTPSETPPGQQVLDLDPFQGHTPPGAEPPTDESSAHLLPQVERRGQLMPGIVYDRAEGGYFIADGNNRNYCCRKLNLPFRAVRLATQPTQRELIALRLSIAVGCKATDKALVGGDLWTLINLSDPPLTEAAVAASLGFTPGYVNKLLKPFKNGIPALVKALIDRRLVPTAAALIAALPPEDQAKALDDVFSYRTITRKRVIAICNGYKPQKQRRERVVTFAVGCVRVSVPADRQVDLLEAFAQRALEAVKQVRKNKLLEKSLPELMQAS